MLELWRLRPPFKNFQGETVVCYQNPGFVTDKQEECIVLIAPVQNRFITDASKKQNNSIIPFRCSLHYRPSYSPSRFALERLGIAFFMVFKEYTWIPGVIFITYDEKGGSSLPLNSVAPKRKKKPLALVVFRSQTLPLNLVIPKKSSVRLLKLTH